MIKLRKYSNEFFFTWRHIQLLNFSIWFSTEVAQIRNFFGSTNSRPFKILTFVQKFIIFSVLKTSTSPVNDKIQFFNGNSASLPSSNRSSEAFNLTKKNFKSDDFQHLHTQEENIKDIEEMEGLKIQNEALKDRLKKNESIISDLQERLSKVEVNGVIPPKRNGIIESSVLEIVNAMAQVSFSNWLKLPWP